MFFAIQINTTKQNTYINMYLHLGMSSMCVCSKICFVFLHLFLVQDKKDTKLYKSKK